MTQNWTSVKASRGRSSRWEKGKTERRIEALGAHVVLDQWDRPAPEDAQAKPQEKSLHDIASQMSSKLVCEGWRYSRSDPGRACWKRFGFS